LWFEQGTDGAGIDTAIGVSADLHIDRAVVDAGAAADAAQGVGEQWIGMDACAPIVEQHQVHLARAVEFIGTPRAAD